MAANAYPALDFDLGETADMLRDTVRDFAETRIAPQAAGRVLNNAFHKPPPTPSAPRLSIWRNAWDRSYTGRVSSSSSQEFPCP